MKNFKILLATVCFVSVCFIPKAFSIPNPWIDCNDDMYCAAQKAGFNLPLNVQNYTVRAMDDMIEINFPLDSKRTVTVRKSQNFDGEADENGIKDISGDYNKYPVNKSIQLRNGVVFNVRGYENKFYVVNFAAESGYYSFSSKDGMSVRDLKRLYRLLEEAEAKRCTFGEKANYTIEQLQDLRRIDGIVEPVFTQDGLPTTLQKKGVTQDCFERANLGDYSNCSVSEIKMIEGYYKKGLHTDSLNEGVGNFGDE